MALRGRFSQIERCGALALGASLPLAVACLACGGSAKPASGSAEESSAATSGERCLQDAAAPRTPPANAPSRIGVSHILIRHAELERPEGATRSPEEACLFALEALAFVQESGDFDAAVHKYSDSGKDSGGQLGMVSRDEVTASFGNAAFALDVNELSYVVESDRGFHIILRTE